MTTATAALLGVLQGLTEFLPVSSTAHLLVGGRLAGYDDAVFTVMIQFGSVLAVVWLYRAKILAVIAGLPADPGARHFVLMLLAAFVPAAAAGALFGDFIQTVLYRTPAVIAWALIGGGVVMLGLERFGPSPEVPDAARTPIRRAFGIGLYQMLALVPGVSRSGATIIGGMAMGLSRPAAAEFSFFLAIPTMGAAFLYELVKLRDQMAVERAVEIGVGFLTAFLAALLVVKPFLRFVARSGFTVFAWYRIAAGTAILAAIRWGWL